MSAVHEAMAGLPDLLAGVPAGDVPDGGSLVGRVGDEAVLLVRDAGVVHAVQAHCPHYGAPLDEGCVHEGQIHCPWHHASFRLDDGGLCRPPALDGLRSWAVDEGGGVIRVSGPDPVARPRPRPPRTRGPVVVVGAGAGGMAAVTTLREAGHDGAIVVLDPDPDAPYDRPNLSKDYLQGSAPEEWLPLRTDGQWQALEVTRLGQGAAHLHPDARVVETARGERIPYDALILAPGASPRRLQVPGAEGSNVHTLRSLADCRALRAAADGASRAIVVGAGFLGLEVAASLRRLDLDVDVVAPEVVPLERVLGTEVGAAVQRLHEARGVRFHLRRSVHAVTADGVRLDDGSRLAGDLVLVAIGVQPRLALAAGAGLAVDGGIVVDGFLETSRKDVFAVGDAARFPHPATGRLMRMEHWAVAEAQGRTAALNVLGHRRSFDDVPFFWTQHYALTLAWTGFPEVFDRTVVEGSVEDRDFVAHLFQGSRPVASVSAGRDRESLGAEFRYRAALRRSAS